MSARAGHGKAVSKRFALLCQHFYPEMVSTGIHMTELATRLAELGWDVTAYTARPSWGSELDAEAPARLSYRGVSIVRVPTLGRQQGGLPSRGAFAVSFALSSAWLLWRRRREHHALVITTNPPFLGIVGWLYSVLARTPYLLIVYDVYPEIVVNLGVVSPDSIIAGVWTRLTRAILRRASTVVVIGRDMADIVRSKLPVERHDRVVLIPNWSDEREVRPLARNENPFVEEHGLGDRFVIQYAGRFGRTHNLEPLGDAARLLADTDAYLQFIGEGPKKATLMRMTAGLENVAFLPYQPMEALAGMLSAADVSVVCLEDGFTGLSVPSKTYGIIASGRPVLGLMDRGSEIGRMIEETGCGIVLEHASGEEVAAALRELIEDPERREAMGRAGRAAFLEGYTLERSSRAYDRALSAMLGLSPSPEGATVVDGVGAVLDPVDRAFRRSVSTADEG